MTATIRELAAWLLARDDIAVFGHRAPDGDACGSCIALTLALRALGKRACACLPGGLPQFLRFLPGQECVVEDDRPPFAPACALAVDVSAPDMLGDNRALFEACPDRALLDHHESNPLFAQLNHVEPDRAATGEMALLLIEALGVPLSAQMATCLFAAVSSDTGNFNYANTTADAFEAAAACVRAGADVDEITRRIYRLRTLSRTRLLGYALSDMVVSGRVAYARVTNDMFRRAGALRCDTERIINFLIEIEGVEIAVLATEQEDGRSTKFSLRSVAPHNVARDVAAPLGGGGHERAAGITIDRGVDEALDMVLRRIEDVLGEAR